MFYLPNGNPTGNLNGNPMEISGICSIFPVEIPVSNLSGIVFMVFCSANPVYFEQWLHSLKPFG
jgi:hypothetical protein